MERPGRAAILTEVHVREPSLRAASDEKATFGALFRNARRSARERPPRPSTKVTGAVTPLR